MDSASSQPPRLENGDWSEYCERKDCVVSEPHRTYRPLHVEKRAPLCNPKVTSEFGYCNNYLPLKCCNTAGREWGRQLPDHFHHLIRLKTLATSFLSLEMLRWNFCLLQFLKLHGNGLSVLENASNLNDVFALAHLA